jgi:hypothetical protein
MYIISMLIPRARQLLDGNVRIAYIAFKIGLKRCILKRSSTLLSFDHKYTVGLYKNK